MNTQQLKDHIKNDIYKGIQTSAAPARMQTDALDYLIDNGLSGSGSGVAIEITDKNDKSSPLWHFGQKSTDTVSGIPALGMDILCIDPSVSTIYFNTPSNTKFTCVCPLGDKDFDNGKRLTILGNFTASEKDSLYAVDRYAYSKFRVGFPMPLDGTFDTTQTLTQTVGIDTNNGFVPSAECHRYVEPIEVVYWNGHWYGKGYDVTLACNEVTDNINKQYLPVTTGAVCNAINGIKNTYVSNTTRDGDLTSLWTGINAKVASVKIGESGTAITPTNGVITLPPYPTEVSGMITAIGVNSYVDAEGHAIIASPDDSGKATLNVMARDGSNTTSGAFKALANKCSSLGDTALASTYVLPVRSGSDTESWKLATISNLNTYNDGRYAAKSHNQASSTINALTGYSKGTSAAALSTTDTLNSALSKLENQIDAKANASDVPSIDGLVKTDASNANETTLVELLKKNSTSTTTITDRTLVVLNGTTAATKAYRIKTDDIIKNLPLGDTYAKATSASAIASTDSVMTALGKLEKGLDGYLPLSGGTIYDPSNGVGLWIKASTGVSAGVGFYANDGTPVGSLQGRASNPKRPIWSASGNYPAEQLALLSDIPSVSNQVTSVAGKTGDVTLAKGDVGLGNVGNFKAVSTVASQGLTDTEKSNARANIGAGTSSLTIGTTSSTAAAGNHNHDGTYLKSYTETDPVFKASAAYNITSTDITNWNGKTSNTGTVTSVAVKMNGSTKGTITSSGTIDLGTVLTSHQSLTAYLKVDGSNGTSAGVSALLNKLTEGSRDPQDADYYIAQYSGGGTTTTTYHRHPVSKLWNYIKSKADSVYAAASHTHSNYLTGITKAMVTTALGYTPPTTDTNTTYTFASGSTSGAFSVTPRGGSAQIVAVKNVVTTDTAQTISGVKTFTNLDIHNSGVRLGTSTTGATIGYSTDFAAVAIVFA